MANDTSSKALNPNNPEFSPARIPSPRTNAGEVSMSVSRSHSPSNSAATPHRVNAKNNGFSFPYTYQGTTYYTRPPPPPPPPSHDGWVQYYPMHHNMDNGYSYPHGNGYAQSFNSGYSNQYHTGYTIPHYNNNFHQHFYNYYCNDNFPFSTPYTNGNAIPDLSAPFTNQISQVHGIRSGLIGQQDTPTRRDSLISNNGQVGNGEWKKKKKKNKRNKRKKYSKSNGKKNGEPANSCGEVDRSEEASNEVNGNQIHNGELEIHSDGKQARNSGDVDGQAITDDESDSQVDSGVAVHRNGNANTQSKSNGKADLSNQLNSDLFYEYRESNDEVKHH